MHITNACDGGVAILFNKRPLPRAKNDCFLPSLARSASAPSARRHDIHITHPLHSFYRILRSWLLAVCCLLCYLKAVSSCPLTIQSCPTGKLFPRFLKRARFYIHHHMASSPQDAIIWSSVGTHCRVSYTVRNTNHSSSLPFSDFMGS